MLNRKEFVALKEDRDYWKKLCAELSHKNVELEEENEQLKADLNTMENKVFHGNKSIEFETYRKCVRVEIDKI